MQKKDEAPPFQEDTNVVDCSMGQSQIQLDRTRYMITPANEKFRKTVRACFLDEWKQGDKFTGCYPVIKFEQYRVDNDRPLKDGKEKSPWGFDIRFRDLPALEVGIQNLKKANKKILQNFYTVWMIFSEKFLHF